MDLQTLLVGFLSFLTDTIIPFLLVIATLFFVWNVVRYFIIGGASEESQEKARQLALWGILAFVLIVSLWGVVRLFVNGLELDNRSIAPDYMCEKGLGGNCRDTLDIDGKSNSTDGFTPNSDFLPS
jgi:hypothetical protein